MLSRRVWLALAQPGLGDPIARRMVDSSPSTQSRPRSKRGRRLWLALAVALCVPSVIALPQVMILALIVPMTLLSLVVLSPALLPFVVPLLGASLTNEIIAGIAAEKSRHTWPLLCAGPGGALHASWSCAIGIARRGMWLLPLRFLARMTLWAGAGLWVALLALTLWLSVTGQLSPGGEQARMLLILALLMGLYLAQLAQTLGLAAVCGVWASAFDWSRFDAALAGLGMYLALAVMPLLAGGWLAARGQGLAAVMLVLAARECGAWLLWRHARWRL